MEGVDALWDKSTFMVVLGKVVPPCNPNNSQPLMYSQQNQWGQASVPANNLPVCRLSL